MARLLTGGAEGRDFNASIVGVDGTLTTTPSVMSWDGATARLGLGQSYMCNSGASNLTGNQSLSFTGAHGVNYYLRVYVRFPVAIASGTIIMKLNGATANYEIRSAGSGTFALFDSGTQIGLASSALSVNTYYRFELRVNTSASASSTELEFMVDGGVVASTTTSNTPSTLTQLSFGWLAAPGANTIVYFDDIALNDDTGADQNTWPGEGKIVMLLPASDNAAGSWLKGSAASAVAFGGTGYLACNFLPPGGTVTPNATNKAISNKVSGATSPNADFNMKTYTAAGVRDTDIVTVVQQVIVHGEDIATGAKTGNFSLVSNPAIGATNVADGATAVFGPAGSGAVGTYPTNWIVQRGPATYNPTVTLGTAPVARITKVDTGTRAADLCFMGIVVEFTPAVAALPPKFRGARQAVNRASTY